MVSTLGADRPDDRPASMRPYFEAKREAEEALRASDLAWTIVRPGSLTDDQGTGRVTLVDRIAGWGSVPRDDVAAVLAALLTADAHAAAGRTLELIAGDVPVAEAVAALG
jgi:uncharacterized protein YbjT (DUF2867 family)